MIDITGLDKAEVLKVLFDNSKQQGLGFMDATGAMPLEIKEARKLVNNQIYFDYLRGRVMKVDISKNDFNPRLFDRDNGEGAAERAINKIRN